MNGSSESAAIAPTIVPRQKRVAIVQSSYIPWKGYFDLIRRVDEFILYDDAQFTRRDWRNRNRIKTAGGPAWLTIPVEVKGRYFQSIKDTKVSDVRWNERHWRSIQASYARAPFYRAYKGAIADLYLAEQSTSLSEINYRFTAGLCNLLSIRTALTWSMDYSLCGDRTQRLVGLCQQAGATEYVSGPSARAYIDPTLFAAAGIVLTFMDYRNYPQYEQLHPPFDHHVSVIDLLLHTGPSAPEFLLPPQWDLEVVGTA
jgi:hypothetical protein